uniref:Bm656, isoform b n=2 Tax=Brugia TaxID=6278 RepID=A0A1I9G4I6_BRUMA|nr:Bm656, isoform b [Brugia malayi]
MAPVISSTNDPDKGIHVQTSSHTLGLRSEFPRPPSITYYPDKYKHICAYWRECQHSSLKFDQEAPQPKRHLCIQQDCQLLLWANTLTGFTIKLKKFQVNLNRTSCVFPQLNEQSAASQKLKWMSEVCCRAVPLPARPKLKFLQIHHHLFLQTLPVTASLNQPVQKPENNQLKPVSEELRNMDMMNLKFLKI